MKQFKNIAISGDIGTGKSTLARKLAEKLGWKHLSAGEYFRRWHKENNVELVDTDQIPEELDRKLDMGFQQKMKVEENTIFESRLAGWLAKDFDDTLKVLCVTDFGTAMGRVGKREDVSIEEASRDSKERAEALVKKFEKLYGVSDFLDSKYFDLVIDTGKLDPEQALEKVIEKIT